jgi:hypothetical protein
MSAVLYYSNQCDHSKELLRTLSKSIQSKDIHFLCIDKREIHKDGGIHIILENEQRLLLPPTIKNVPSLMLLNHGNRVVSGLHEISHYLKPGEVEINKQATNMNGEPLAFSFDEMGTTLSDNYSYLDMSADELLAKGSGGLRQMHNYMSINGSQSISTPPDNYEPDKVGSVDMSKLQQQRETDLRQKR